MDQAPGLDELFVLSL